MQDNNSHNDIDRKLKEEEILRLTSLENKRFIRKSEREPRIGILTDDEILDYARNSIAASEIRLKRGFGTLSDKIKIYKRILIVMWIFIPFFVLLELAMLVSSNFLYSTIFAFLLGFVLWCTIYLLFLKDYSEEIYIPKEEEKKKVKPKAPKKTKPNLTSSHKSYEKKVYDLEELYKLKEGMAIDLIEKRFDSTSLTYDRFISVLNLCKTAFYNEVNITLAMTELSDKNNEQVTEELEEGMTTLKMIIGKLDELTNELVVDLGSENDSEVEYLLDEMENLIESVKDYK